MKALFCNIGLMEKYEGLSDDAITDGGSYVNKEHRGAEVCNFSRDGHGFLYGYVQRTNGTIDIERIGANSEESSISGVTVFWTARRRGVGTVVVGYYKNATVFREYQKFIRIPPAQRRNSIDGYWIKARADQSKLFTNDERTCEIPRRVKGGMGQNPVWYADNAKSKPIVKKVLDFINNGRSNVPSTTKKKAKQDQERKAQIENAAIRCCRRHYKQLGYSVESVEKDNRGWDLEATSGKAALQIEVKGLSGQNFLVELTPNEYKAFSDKSDSYRLAVVLGALDKPKLYICRYSEEWGKWIVEGQENKSLDVTIKQSAQIHYALN